MRKNFAALLATTLSALLLTSAVRADTIPWGYSASDVEIFNSNTPLKTSSVKFTGSTGVANGDSGIIIYNLTTTSSVDSSSPDSFENVPFALSVALTDIKATSSKSGVSKTSDTVNFAGTFSGTNATKSSLLPGERTWTSPIKAETVLGSDDTGWRKYTLEIDSFTPPGQPGGAPGSIQAIVHISDTTPPPGGDNGSGNNGGENPGGGTGSGETPPQTPEPASLVLAGFGVPFAFFAARRRRRQAENAQA